MFRRRGVIVYDNTCTTKNPKQFPFEQDVVNFLLQLGEAAATLS